MQLRDGTTIIGTFGGNSLNISTSWGGEVAFNLQEISEISCDSAVAEDTQHTSPNPAIQTYKEERASTPPIRTQTQHNNTFDGISSRQTPPPNTWARAPAPLKKTIAVSTFENRASLASAGEVLIARGLADQLTDSLVQSGCFKVLDRQILESVIAEQDFASSARTTKEGEAARTGKIVSAQMMVKGAVTEFDPGTADSGQTFSLYGFTLGSKRTEAYVAVIIYLVNTSTTQVLDSQRVEGIAESGGMAWGFQGQNLGIGQAGFKKTPLARQPR